jgi:hypothetical protein
MGSTDIRDISKNTGWIQRKQLFMNESNTDYVTYPIHFLAKIMTEFQPATNALIIPGTKNYIHLKTFSSFSHFLVHFFNHIFVLI